MIYTPEEHKKSLVKSHARYQGLLAEERMKCLKMYPRTSFGRSLYTLIMSLEKWLKNHEK